MDIGFKRSKKTNQEGRKERDRTGFLSPLLPAWEAEGVAAPRARAWTRPGSVEGRDQGPWGDVTRVRAATSPGSV